MNEKYNNYIFSWFTFISPFTAAPAGPSAEQLEDQWDTVSGDLSAIFQGRGTIPEDVVPFDAASEMEEAQQRFDFYSVALSCYSSKLQQGLFKNY